MDEGWHPSSFPPGQRPWPRLLTRRQVLRWGLAGGALALLPGRVLLGCGGTVKVSSPSATASFLSDAERQILRAVTARIIPTDVDAPGAADADAAEYINRLLTFVPSDTDPVGEVFAGGPFSGRNPFPDPTTGTPSNVAPADDFVHFIPLTQRQILSWRVQVLGSAAVSGADFNAAVLGPTVGLRDRYRDGLASIQSTSRQMFSADFVALTAEQQDAVLAAIDADFFTLLTEHTIEGTLCDPVYGGNKDRVGWTMIGYDGDSQPLGYSIFDATTMAYNERPDKPTSTANPDEDFSGVDAITDQFLRGLVRAVGGPHFP